MSMLSIASVADGHVDKVPAGLSDRLVWLTKFGKPSVNKTKSDGWYGLIEMHVSAKGTTFDIRSDYDCASPDAAINQLIERMLDTLAKIGRGE